MKALKGHQGEPEEYYRITERGAQAMKALHKATKAMEVCACEGITVMVCVSFACDRAPLPLPAVVMLRSSRPRRTRARTRPRSRARWRSSR